MDKGLKIKAIALASIQRALSKRNRAESHDEESFKNSEMFELCDETGDVNFTEEGWEYLLHELFGHSVDGDLGADMCSDRYQTGISVLDRLEEHIEDMVLFGHATLHEADFGRKGLKLVYGKLEEFKNKLENK
jgi:hypothetical protein